MNVMAALDARPAPSSKKVGKAAVKGEAKGKPVKNGLGPKPPVSADEIRAKIAKQNEGPASTPVLKTENRVTSSFNDNPEEVQRRSEEAKRALALKKQASDEANSKPVDPAAVKTDEGEEVSAQRPSDVGKNDPTDPATVGKLKDLLSKGAFKFSDKERAALSKILT